MNRLRPIKLSIKAFGPYAQTQVIDFNELGERSFFLICGPTGSGKTTILDAVCFALYGDTSGAYRDGKQLRSDHADISESTEIKLDFNLGFEKYRVFRKPQQERPKLRGEGIKVEPAGAVLWKITDCEDNDEGKVLADGSNNVTNEVEKLMGFKSSQFRQVVLLPQGDFRKLLLAKSEERQKILEALFKTEYYGLIEKKLKDQEKILKNEVNDIEENKKGLLNAAECENKEELVERYNKNKEDVKEFEEKVEISRKNSNNAREKLEEGKKTHEKLQEEEKAKKYFKDLIDKQKQVDVKRDELDKAKKTDNLLDMENNLKILNKEEKEANNLLCNTKKELDKAEEMQQKSKELLDIEEQKEKLREETSKKINYLESLVDKVSNLEEALKKRQLVNKNFNDAEKNKNVVQENIKNIEKEIETLKEKIEMNTGKVNDLAEVQINYNKIETTFEKRKNLDKLNKELNAVTKKYKDNKIEISKLEENYLEVKGSLNKLQEKWNNGQAAVLAKNLQENTPCPVCGSLSHPVPSRSSEEIPTEEDLKKMRQQLDTKEDKLNKYRNKNSEIAAQKTTLENKIEDIKSEIGNDAGVSVDTIEQNYLKISKKLKETKEAQIRLKKLEEKLKENEIEKRKTEEVYKKAENDYYKIQTELKSTEAVLNELKKEVPEKYYDLNSLKKDQKKLHQEYDSMKKAYQEAVDNSKKASELLSSKKTEVKNFREALQKVNKKLKEAKENFIIRLRKSGFNNFNEYNSAKRSQKYINALEQKIKEYDEKVSAAKDWIKRTEEAALNLKAPDLDRLSEVYNRAEKDREEKIKLYSELKQKLKNEDKWIKNIEEIQKKLKTLEDKYYIIGKLSEVANGKNNYGITLERFILGALLDDVLVAATKRLNLMSRGRYQLKRTLDRARSNAQGGLDLEVFDNYTGSCRSVATLSGGETFIASLSLALGLADVVQAYSGGIRLDTIFIDEGFGSLDSETMDFAIKTLLDLQEGGRLIGIISHVAELKERIDTRLEVSITDRGSKASFYTI